MIKEIVTKLYSIYEQYQDTNTYQGNSDEIMEKFNSIEEVTCFFIVHDKEKSTFTCSFLGKDLNLIFGNKEKTIINCSLIHQ